MLGNLLDLEGVELKAVCDVVPDRVRAAQQRIVAKGRSEREAVPDFTRGAWESQSASPLATG